MGRVRRLRGFLLGILLLGLNILLVATLVIATSGGGLSRPADADPASPAPGETPGPTATAADPTASETEDPTPTLPVRFASGDAVSVVVLGDQTGTDEDDWVQAWARTLAGIRRVELFSLSATDPTIYDDPIVLGAAPQDGAGRISIHNGSSIGASPAYVTPRLPLLMPPDADVVLLSFGRSNTPADITRELSGLSAALARDWPGAEVRVIVQPPRQDGEPVLDELVRDWAADAGLAVIDVAAVFVAEGIVEATVSTRDPLSVNILGGLTWARVVQDSLFGPIERSE